VDTAASFQIERQAMVEEQLRARGIRDARILEAMATVPRHEFVPVRQVSAAYEDRALPIGEWETISQPFIVALMTESADVGPGDRVLEVGTGTGYQAAILAHLGARVYTLELNPALAEAARERLTRLGYGDAVEVVIGDGSEGYPAAAPYDAILVTAASPAAPQSLLHQLVDGRRLVIPIGSRHEQELKVITKVDGRTSTRAISSVQFVPLIGKEGWSGISRWPIL
jgi:protein-L-isoaspartate(D-aspartate) O-methyltransferase